jgi:hypothetical protein
LAAGKEIVQVQVLAVHSLTHEDRGVRATVDKGILGANAPTKEMEFFNLDTIINGASMFCWRAMTPRAVNRPALGATKVS